MTAGSGGEARPANVPSGPGGEARPADAQAPELERNIVAVASGGGITFAAKLFLTASRFALAVLLARLLGAHDYGLYSLALSAAAIGAGVALLGMDAALVRYVAINAGRRDEAGVWGALQVGLGASLLASVAVSAGMFALAYPIAARVFGEPALAPLLQLSGAIVPLLTMADVLASASRGFRRMDYAALAQFIAQPIVRLALTLALALLGMSPAAAVVVYGLASGAAALILLVALNRQFALRRPLRAARRETGAIMGFALPFWMSGLITTFQGNLQTLLVGALGSIAGAGVFAMADALNSLGNLFSSSINTSARPVIAELYDRDERAQLGAIYQTAAKWALTVNLPIFLASVLYPAQLLAIFGEDFTVGARALAILACANLANVGTGMGGIILDMAGYSRLKLINTIVRLTLHLGLNIALIPRWGIDGAALAVLIAEGTLNLIRLVQVFVLMRLLPYSRGFAKPIAAGLLALASALLAGGLLPAEPGPLATLALVLLLCAVYGGAIMLMGLSPLERSMLARVGRRARAL